jgi:hypothetical protein
MLVFDYDLRLRSLSALSGTAFLVSYAAAQYDKPLQRDALNNPKPFAQSLPNNMFSHYRLSSDHVYNKQLRK